MSKIKTCPTCRGRKEMQGLGMLVVTCKECRGIGWVEEKAIPEVKPEGKVETKKSKSGGDPWKQVPI